MRAVPSDSSEPASGHTANLGRDAEPGPQISKSSKVVPQTARARELERVGVDGQLDDRATGLKTHG